MGEPLRPPPDRSLTDRAGDAIRAVGVARLLVGAVAVLAVAAGGWWLVRSPTPPVEDGLPRAGASTSTAVDPTVAGSVTASTPDTIVVHVAGAVVAPGLVSVATGSRVDDVVRAAGGLSPDASPDALSQLNLAAPVSDGQQVRVPRVGELVVIGPDAAEVPTGPLDLNLASVADLDGLPGIGPSTAQAIVDHRDQHGPFASVDDLLDVRGIGPAKLDALRGLVTV